MTVLRVVVISNDAISDANGDEHEDVGIAFCQQLLGGGPWVQTSFSGRIRKRFAGIGMSYDQARNAFIPERPSDAVGFDEETCDWIMPTRPPNWGRSE